MTQLKYCNNADDLVIRVLVRTIIDSGYNITINDGEEEILSNSFTPSEIFESLTSTGEDFITVFKDTQYIGWYHLIYNNGSDEEPMVVISDYTVKEEIENIYYTVNTIVSTAKRLWRLPA